MGKLGFGLLEEHPEAKKNRQSSRFFFGAAARDRTGTTVARREILSLLRLPVPPQRHALVRVNNIESQFFVKINPATSSEVLPTQTVSDLLFFRDDLLDLIGSIESAFSRAGTPGNNFLLPDRCIHVFRPEWPGAALPGPGFVDPAAVVLKKWTVLARILKFVEPIHLFGIRCSEGGQGQLEMGSQAPPVAKGQIYITISPARYATFSVPLAFEAKSLFVKLFSFAHFYSGSMVEIRE